MYAEHRAFPRWRLWTSVLLIAAAILAAYVNAFDAAFVYDDGPNVRDNQHIRSLWPPWEPLSIPLWNSGLTVDGRPALSLSFALNRRLLGPTARGYRVVNIAIHIAAALLLFGIVWRTVQKSSRFKVQSSGFGFRDFWLAAAVALLWAVHPLQTESVTYITQRCESLAGMLVLLTLYCAVRGFHAEPGSRPARFWFAGSILACFVGAGTKETVAAAPFIVLLYDWFFVSGSARAALRRRPQLYTLLLSCWLLISGLVLLSSRTKLGDMRLTSPAEYALTQPGALLRYLRLCFVPYPLVMDYNWPVARGAMQIAPPLLAILAMLALSIWAFHRRHWAGFLGACFLVVLAPSSSIFPSRQTFQEHRMYLALTFVVVAVVLGADCLLRRLCGADSPAAKASRPRLLLPVARTVLVVGVVVPLILLTRHRNSDYESELTLWTQNVRQRPGSYVAHSNLGILIDRAGQHAKATKHFWQALAINPRYSPAHYNWANTLVTLGNHGDAVAHYREAILLNPRHDLAHNNLGNLLQKQGRNLEAIAHFRDALIINPLLAGVHYNWGNALAGLDRFDEAVIHYERAIERKPEHADAYRNLGNSLAALGSLEAAGDSLLTAARLEPKQHATHINLGTVRAMQGNLPAAAACYRKALALSPGSALAHYLLSKVLVEQGDTKAAAEHMRRGLEHAEAAGDEALAAAIRKTFDGHDVSSNR